MNSNETERLQILLHSRFTSATRWGQEAANTWRRSHELHRNLDFLISVHHDSCPEPELASFIRVWTWTFLTQTECFICLAVIITKSYSLLSQKCFPNLKPTVFAVFKDGQHVSTIQKLTPKKSKCRLMPITSFGARVCPVAIEVQPVHEVDQSRVSLSHRS